jgi:hypothetical protein
MVMRESSQWFGKNIVQSTVLKKSGKAWICALAASEILLKTALNTRQNHFCSENIYSEF